MRVTSADWTTILFGVFVLTGCGGGNSGAGPQTPTVPANPSAVEIQSLVASPAVVQPGESVVLSVSATGGTGSALTYLWQVASGGLSSLYTNPVTWTAPSTTVGSVLLSVDVTNAAGFIATGFANVLVSASPPSGPFVTSANPLEVKVGSEIRVTGTGFGSNQGSGSLIIGGVAAGNIVSWGDTQIRAMVPAGASTGSVKVVGGGAESNPSGLVVLWTKENPENAVISTALNDQESPQLIPDGTGGAILAWEDSRGGTTFDIYAQRVDSTGALLWSADGIAVSTAANNQRALQLIPDGAGGAILAWQDFRGGSTSDIYAQRVDGAGALLWSANGIAVSTAANNQGVLQLIPDGAGGAIIAWEDFRSGTSSDIYAQRVTSAGTLLWPTNGIAVSTAVNNQNDLQLISDDAGGAIIAWQDFRSGPTSDIYAQRVDGAGSTLWSGNGVAVCTAANGQGTLQLTPDGTGGAIIVWQDLRSGTTFDLYAQRVNGGGGPIWPANGIILSTAANDQYSPHLVPDGYGGAIIAWRDSRGGTTSDIYAQRVSGAGLLLWPADGIAVSTAADSQGALQLIPDGAGGAIIAWQDPRSGTNYDIYAQEISAGGRE